jgi:two-component system nitrate/nitrite response regulator NarL
MFHGWAWLEREDIPEVPYSEDVAAPALRILVVGDDALARVGLRAVAEAAGLAVAADRSPEDVDPDGGDAADAAVFDLGEGALHLDRLRVIAERRPTLAVLWREDQARDALAAGAQGVLLRDRLDDRLGSAVRAVADGLLVADEALAEAVLRPPAPAAPDLVEPLTARELEVLQLVAEGLTNRRIGARLGISEHTAKFHVNAILGKLGARSRGEAVAQAARLGLLLL